MRKKNKKKLSPLSSILTLKEFGKAAWNFIFSIYESGWDLLLTDKHNNFFRTKVLNKFMLKVPNNNSGSTLSKFKDKAAEIVKLSPSIPAHLPKEFLEKSKFFGKRNNTIAKAKTNTKQFYA